MTVIWYCVTKVAAARAAHPKLLDGEAQSKELRRRVQGVPYYSQSVSVNGRDKEAREKVLGRPRYSFALIYLFFLLGFFGEFSTVTPKIGRRCNFFPILFALMDVWDTSLSASTPPRS